MPFLLISTFRRTDRRKINAIANRYIETNRGKLFKEPSPEAEELDEEVDEGEEELSAEEIDTNDLDL